RAPLNGGVSFSVGSPLLNSVVGRQGRSAEPGPPRGPAAALGAALPAALGAALPAALGVGLEESAALAGCPAANARATAAPTHSPARALHFETTPLDDMNPPGILGENYLHRSVTQIEASVRPSAGTGKWCATMSLRSSAEVSGCAI